MPIQNLKAQDYPNFHAIVTVRWGYTFVPYETITEDGWTLTLFRITGKVG
jgi:hypothetical protein